jgi:hypothetical protein
MRGDITGIMTHDVAELSLTVQQMAASSLFYKLRRDLKCSNFFMRKMLQRNKKVNRIREM